MVITWKDVSLCRGFFQYALNHLHQFSEAVRFGEKRHSCQLAQAVADPRAAWGNDNRHERLGYQGSFCQLEAVPAGADWP